MRILVTGGAGFIGSHVGAALAAGGHEVVGLDCQHPAAHGPLPAKRSLGGLIVGDLRDRLAVESALRGVDAVVHHAAMVGMGVDLNDLPEYVSCNDLGTAVLLHAMARARIGRLVLASSMVVYGEGAYACPRHGRVSPRPRRREDLAAGSFEPRCPACDTALAPRPVTEAAPLQPRSVYAATKVAQEHLAGAWALAGGFHAIALRYHNVYGPGMPRDTPYAGVVAIFRSSLERGLAPRVFEDGAQRRDFIHVADVAQANVAAIAAVEEVGGLRAFNIASGQPHTVHEMAVALASAVGGPEPEVTREFRAGDVRHITASPARAEQELGFAATVAFVDGMNELARAQLRR